jgi:asparagine synthase (glutamine-hydrolysing)
MCGIAVAIDWGGAEHAVRVLLQGVQHRGDVTDPVLSPRKNTAMGTRRLRIVDADRAVQPQASFDGRLLVSFNGEIYNHTALRRELKGMGVPFRTESDTEVLANALQVWGIKAMPRLNGMFAFVALDVASGEFLAARDPFGVKPLYVVQSETGFLFCSEIRPLLSASETGEILLLPPGYALTRKLCAGYKSSVSSPFGGRSEGDLLTLDRLLAGAVQVRLPQDIPFAIMLSGGIDSTLVANYAQMERPDAPGYFLGNEQAHDFPYVAEYSALSGTDLRIVPFDPRSDATLARIGDVVSATESFEPSVIRGAVCSYVLSEAIQRDGFRVALCGEGADELFAGYVPLEWAFRLGEEQGRFVRDQALAHMHTTVLQRVDRCSMRFALETREPFLDPGVAAYALNLRGDALVENVNALPRGKKPLRALYDLYPERLPKNIRDRSKVLFDEGAGLESGPASAWADMFEDEITAQDLREGCREFEAFGIQSREELFCIRALARTMDISRVPHLRARVNIQVPGDVEQALSNIHAV